MRFELVIFYHVDSDNNNNVKTTNSLVLVVVHVNLLSPYILLPLFLNVIPICHWVVLLAINIKIFQFISQILKILNPFYPHFNILLMLMVLTYFLLKSFSHSYVAYGLH